MTDWHQCHFCGTDVKDGYEAGGVRHYLSDCRPDLVEHRRGPDCTWAYRNECYADHANGRDFVYADGPM